jgi:hypothetical protein
VRVEEGVVVLQPPGELREDRRESVVVHVEGRVLLVGAEGVGPRNLKKLSELARLLGFVNASTPSGARLEADRQACQRHPSAFPADGSSDL